jgi:hypothetical protein
MLWYKILQNTTYCGILHFISYYVYGKDWGSLVRLKISRTTDGLFLHIPYVNCCQFVHFKLFVVNPGQGGGLKWIGLLLP